MSNPNDRPLIQKMNNSLCCDAPINEQFSTCTDCGEHAEINRGPSTAGTAFVACESNDIADVDAVNILLAKDERPSTEPYMLREFPSAAQTMKQAAGMVALVVGLIAFFTLLSVAQEVFAK